MEVGQFVADLGMVHFILLFNVKFYNIMRNAKFTELNQMY